MNYDFGKSFDQIKKEMLGDLHWSYYVEEHSGSFTYKLSETVEICLEYTQEEFSVYIYGDIRNLHRKLMSKNLVGAKNEVIELIGWRYFKRKIQNPVWLIERLTGEWKSFTVLSAEEVHQHRSKKVYY